MGNPYYDLETEKAHKMWVQVGVDCVKGPHELTSVEETAVASLADEAQKKHRLAGVWSSEHSIVVVQLMDHELVDDWKRGRMSSLLWGWPGLFGGTLTLTVYLHGTEDAGKIVARAAIPFGDPMIEVIHEGSFLLAVVHGKQVIRCDRIDYTDFDDGRIVVDGHIQALEEEPAKAWIEPETNFWETVHHQKALVKYLSASDRLSLGWYDRLSEARRARTILETLIEEGFGNVCRKLELDEAALGLVEAIEQSNGDFAVVRDYLFDTFGDDLNRALYFFMEKFKDLPDEAEGGYPHSGVAGLMQAFWDCAGFTDCGRKLPWIDTSGRIQWLELEPRSFPKGIDAREFWTRLDYDSLRFGWGYLLSGADVSVSKSELLNMLDVLPSCENVEECEEQAEFLLNEADANKEGCIPPNAVVELSVGPFVEIELREVHNNVLVALRHENGLVLFSTVEPEKSYWSVELPFEEDDNNGQLAARKATAAIKLLLAAVIRDFWVVEHRERVFQTKQVESRLTGRNTPNSGPRIVYLPRVKYDFQESPDVEKCGEQLDTTVRRSHFVQGHLRRSQQPSEHQLALAARYGIIVPEGYTFVRPHERGKSERDVIYRSRSALRSLYSELPESGELGSVEWFRFEKDVKRLMETLGFNVEHVAASGRGDMGVDVFATKGTDLDAVHWVIQCKCWKLNRKISPSVIRELAGTMTRYPQGTRGMVVTTSDFTSGAINEAEAHGIRLMPGKEFAERLAGTSEEGSE